MNQQQYEQEWANWHRYLRTAGITNWHALSPAMQDQVAGQFPAWLRRQRMIGRIILGVITFVVLVSVLVITTTYWL